MNCNRKVIKCILNYSRLFPSVSSRYTGITKLSTTPRTDGSDFDLQYLDGESSGEFTSDCRCRRNRWKALGCDRWILGSTDSKAYSYRTLVVCPILYFTSVTQQCQYLMIDSLLSGSFDSAEHYPRTTHVLNLWPRNNLHTWLVCNCNNNVIVGSFKKSQLKAQHHENGKCIFKVPGPGWWLSVTSKLPILLSLELMRRAATEVNMQQLLQACASVVRPTVWTITYLQVMSPSPGL